MPALCTKRLGCAPVDVDFEARRVGRASPRRLQFETAATWVARAAAFDQMAVRLEQAGRTAQARRAAAQRDDALHEAYEHAALADATGTAVSRVRPAFQAAVLGRRAGRR